MPSPISVKVAVKSPEFEAPLLDAEAAFSVQNLEQTTQSLRAAWATLDGDRYARSNGQDRHLVALTDAVITRNLKATEEFLNGSQFSNRVKAAEKLIDALELLDRLPQDRRLEHEPTIKRLGSELRGHISSRAVETEIADGYGATAVGTLARLLGEKLPHQYVEDLRVDVATRLLNEAHAIAISRDEKGGHSPAATIDKLLERAAVYAKDANCDISKVSQLIRDYYHESSDLIRGPVGAWEHYQKYGVAFPYSYVEKEQTGYGYKVSFDWDFENRISGLQMNRQRDPESNAPEARLIAKLFEK